MAPSNFKEPGSGQRGCQRWIIEDSWEGTKYVEARLIKSWQGVCGVYKLLEAPDGQYFFWTVLPAVEGRGALQRLVIFPDQETMAAELNLAVWHGPADEPAALSFH